MKYQKLIVEIQKYPLGRTGDMLRERQEEEGKERTQDSKTKQ